MCEGGNAETPPRRVQQQQQQQDASAPTSCLDAVPPVVLGNQQQQQKDEQFELVYRTPQLLGSFVAAAADNESDSGAVTTFSVPPLLVHQRYLVAACQRGRICLWNLAHLPALQRRERERQRQQQEESLMLATTDTLCPVPPLQVCDLSGDVPAPLTAIAVGDTSCTLLPTSSTTSSSCLIVACSAVGTITVLAFQDDDDDDDDDDAKNQNQLLSTVASWNTGASGITAVAILPEAAAAAAAAANTAADAGAERRGVDPPRIVVGYDTGCVEAWTLTVQPAATQDVNTTGKETSKKEGVKAAAATTTTSVSTKTDNDDTTSTACCWTESLLWRGLFSDQPTVTAISQLHVDNGDSRQKESDCEQASTAATGSAGRGDYLLLTLHYRGAGGGGAEQRPDTVEVLDLESVAAAAWRDATTSKNKQAVVPLEQHWILPAPGKEIVGNSSASCPSIPSLGTNCLTPRATGLSDGTVVLLDAAVACSFEQPSSSSRDNCSAKGSLSWGVKQQVQLAYPCIGIGSVDLSSWGNGGGATHTACCLRGSSTYLISNHDTNDDDDDDDDGGCCTATSIQALSIPHDLDEDASTRYLQSFYACTVHLKDNHQKNESVPLPMLVYVWPGGVMDIYACGLLLPPLPLLPVTKKQTTELLHELVAKGAAERLHVLLSSSSAATTGDDDDDGLCGEFDKALGRDWRQARDEVRALPKHAESLGMEDICSDGFATFRSVLIRLSSP